MYVNHRCDCYILKDILNNWSDEASNVILTNLFAAVTRGNRVLIIERVLHTGGTAEEVVSVQSCLHVYLLVQTCCTDDRITIVCMY